MFCFNFPTRKAPVLLVSNMENQNTYSPSIYKRAYGLSDVTNTCYRKGAFSSMLMSAKEDVQKETTNKHDEITAKRLQKYEDAYAQKVEEQEREDLETAEKFQREEHDAFMAQKIAERERKEAQQEKMRKDRMEKEAFEYAQKLQEDEEKEATNYERERLRQLKKDEAVARKLHKNESAEIQREEARKEKERLQKEKEAAREAKERKKEERKGLEAARKLHLMEEKKIKLARQKSEKIAEQDMEMARRLQETELSEIIEETEKVTQKWKEPTVEVEEQDNGVLLLVELSGVRRMEVDLDEEERVVYVTAVPKSKTYDPLREHHPELRKMVSKDKIESSKFHIDLTQIVDGYFTHTDIDSKYDPKTGNLTIFVHDVHLSSKQKRSSFLSKMSSNLSKMFSRKKCEADEARDVGEGLPAAAIKRRNSKK